MKSSRAFGRSAEFGAPLSHNEARVFQVEGTPEGRRVWLGSDDENNAVAYFEAPADPEYSFTVSRVISVATLEVGIGPNAERTRTARARCHDPRLNEVFFSFIDDLLDKLDPAVSVQAVITAAAADWRSLLLVAGTPMSATAATGLYGELSFLESASIAVGPWVLELWQRNPREVHDFVGEFARVEVKTSDFQNQRVVSIHGLKQLLASTDSTLTLAVADVQRHGDGDSLDQIVGRLLDLGLESDRFIEKLKNQGFVRGMASAAEHRFQVQSWSFWEITNESPVITSNTLDQEIVLAVSNVSYSLSLGALGDSEPTFDWARLGAPDENGASI